MQIPVMIKRCYPLSANDNNIGYICSHTTRWYYLCIEQVVNMKIPFTQKYLYRASEYLQKQTYIGLVCIWYIVKLKKFSLKYFIFVDTLFFMVFPHIAISLKFCDSRLPLKFFIALSILKFAEFQERSTYITWPWCQRQWPWIYFVPGIKYTDTFMAQ